MENVSYQDNTFEHTMSYNEEGERREVALVHLPGMPPKLVIATIPIAGNPNMEPAQIIESSLEEVRICLNFMNTLLSAGLLG